MRRRFPLIAFVLFVSMFSPAIFACTIEIFPGAKKARRQAAAVFVAKVLEIRSLTNSYAVAVTFAVTRSWKGIKASELTVEGDQGLICSSIKFEEGRTYLVYAYDRGGGFLVASDAPGYSKRIEDAAKDVKDLGAPRIVFSR